MEMNNLKKNNIMKTNKKRLTFKKDSIIELNESQLNQVTGGTDPVTLVSAVISWGLVGLLVVGVVIEAVECQHKH